MADNIKAKLEGSMLTITIDLSKDLGPSKSGKTNIVATTRGNRAVGDLVKCNDKFSAIKLGINCYK